MTDKIQQRLNFLKKDLINEAKKYDDAYMTGAGFDKRKAIRIHMREIREKIEELGRLA